MIISRQLLEHDSADTGFRAEILEKVLQLLHLLNAVNGHPFLKQRLALKGGTALNLFHFNVPRLSVDVDLNYIGVADREAALGERASVEAALHAVFAREEMVMDRLPTDHAGGKWRLRYPSALSGMGNLELDLNYMFRVPLWPVERRDSRAIGSTVAKDIPILDIHELAAGKLAALFARQASRDVFDAHQLLTTRSLAPDRLRLGFVVYGAMNRLDWRTVSLDRFDFRTRDLTDQLLPVLRRDHLRTIKTPERWAEDLGRTCHAALSVVLPLTAAERTFLDLLLDRGEIHPEFLTSDHQVQARITAQPLLQWKAINVRKHRGI